MIINGITFVSGQPVNCRIKGRKISGVIHVSSEQERAWICHNIESFCGNASPNMWGYPFSWIFRFSDGEFTDDVSDIEPVQIDEIEWKATSMPQEFRYVLEQIMTTRELQIAFNTKLTPFENFDVVEKSDKAGFIVLKGSCETDNGNFAKKVEIKLSRYLKKISDSYVKFMKQHNKDVQPLFSDPVIESIYNKLVAYSNGELLKLRLLSGTDINYGYKSDNYAKQIGTISKSCMSNKIDFLDIYRNNENCKLAVLESGSGVEARCLVWEEGDVTYFDRIYYTYDWIAKSLEKKLTDMGFANIKSKTLTKITLSNWNFEYYPYIDSFRFQLKGTNDFYQTTDLNNLPKGEYRVYCQTGGSFANHEVR